MMFAAIEGSSALLINHLFERLKYACIHAPAKKVIGLYVQAKNISVCIKDFERLKHAQAKNLAVYQRC